MIRQPTPIDDLFRWHRDTLAGKRPPRFEEDPECGWYVRRFVKDGPFIPVRIFMEQVVDPETGELTQPEVLRAEVLGDAADPYRVWTFCRAIPREDYDALVLRHRTEQIMAATNAPVDLSKTPMRPGART